MTNETADAARLDALGYVEQTIYANEDSSAAVTWPNSDVLGLLEEIAERLRVTPEADDEPLADRVLDGSACTRCGAVAVEMVPDGFGERGQLFRCAEHDSEKGS